MKRTLSLIALSLLFSLAASAQISPTVIVPPPSTGAGGGSGGDLKDHGGAKLSYAHLVYIFWGTFPYGYTAEMQTYRDLSGGMSSHLGMLAQYGTPQTTLTPSQADVFDATEPPATVTDADAQAEVRRQFGGQFDPKTVYVLLLPPDHLSTKDGRTSCTGFCGYHFYFLDSASGKYVQYAVIPYVDPSCGTCSVHTADLVQANDVQSAEVWTLHEVREAITDPQRHTWYDDAGNEADDKCQFNPNDPASDHIFYMITPAGPNDTPYYHPGHTFFFQREWSNSTHSCVQ
jgi:hypothetical protein